MSAAPIPQDYSAIGRSIADCIAKVSKPLTVEQRALMTAGIAVWMDKQSAALAASEARADALEAELFAHESKEFNETQDALLRAEAAEQSLAEAVKDAARYRWLRDSGPTAPGRRPCAYTFPPNHSFPYPIGGSNLDAAIDAMLLKGDKP